MQRSTQTLCVALIVGIFTTLARGQSLAFLSPEITTEGAAAARKSTPPELTLEEAVALAVANNSSLQNSSLETQRAADDLAASRTKRFATTQVVALGAQLVTKASLTFPEGSLGTYSATGPIPATNQKTEIARKPAGTFDVSVVQPLSTQYQLHLQLKALSLPNTGMAVTIDTDAVWELQLLCE